MFFNATSFIYEQSVDKFRLFKSKRKNMFRQWSNYGTNGINYFIATFLSWPIVTHKHPIFFKLTRSRKCRNLILGRPSNVLQQKYSCSRHPLTEVYILWVLDMPALREVWECGFIRWFYGADDNPKRSKRLSKSALIFLLQITFYTLIDFLQFRYDVALSPSKCCLTVYTKGDMSVHLLFA